MSTPGLFSDRTRVGVFGGPRRKWHFAAFHAPPPAPARIAPKKRAKRAPARPPAEAADIARAVERFRALEREYNSLAAGLSE